MDRFANAKDCELYEEMLKDDTITCLRQVELLEERSKPFDGRLDTSNITRLIQVAKKYFTEHACDQDE